MRQRTLKDAIESRPQEKTDSSEHVHTRLASYKPSFPALGMVLFTIEIGSSHINEHNKDNQDNPSHSQRLIFTWIIPHRFAQ